MLCLQSLRRDSRDTCNPMHVNSLSSPHRANSLEPGTTAHVQREGGQSQRLGNTGACPVGMCRSVG